MRSSRRALRLLPVAFAGLAIGGCSSSNPQLAEFRGNPTPELDTLSQRPDDIQNRIVVTNDTNLRMMSEDLGRFWLLDRPSRLSRTTIPY